MSYNSGTEERKLRYAFHKLNTSEFEPLVAFLESRLEDSRETLAKGTELQTLFRAQGRVEVLRDLLKQIAGNRNFS